MKCFLGISNFLEEISSLSHSVVFPYFFALMAEELSFLKNFYCNRVDLQCCVSFCCTAKSISYIYPLFLRFFSHIGHKSILTIVPCAISVQFSSVQSLSHVRLFATPCCSTPGFPVHHQVPKPTQTHVVCLENSQTLLIPTAGALNGGLTAQVVFQRGTRRWRTGGQSACPKTRCPCCGVRGRHPETRHQSFSWEPASSPSHPPR